jgi:hypothetical protein
VHALTDPFEEEAEEEAAAALGFRELPASDLQAQGNRNSDFEEYRICIG